MAAAAIAPWPAQPPVFYSQPPNLHNQPMAAPPLAPLPPRNETELTREMLITILTYFSTLIPSHFNNRPIRLVVHGGACMLLHTELYKLSQQISPTAGWNPALQGSAPQRRTTTRDVDYIHRSFAAECSQWGIPDATERLKSCIRITAQRFQLGLDWMNSDADVALPLDTDSTGVQYDPIYRAAIQPNNIHVHTIFTSPNGLLTLISVAPYWAVALKLVRYAKWDPGDITLILRNGSHFSGTVWTPDIIERWLSTECKSMGYARYDSSRKTEMRNKITHAVQMVSMWGGSNGPMPGSNTGFGGTMQASAGGVQPNTSAPPRVEAETTWTNPPAGFVPFPQPQPQPTPTPDQRMGPPLHHPHQVHTTIGSSWMRQSVDASTTPMDGRFTHHPHQAPLTNANIQAAEQHVTPTLMDKVMRRPPKLKRVQQPRMVQYDPSKTIHPMKSVQEFDRSISSLVHGNPNRDSHVYVDAAEGMILEPDAVSHVDATASRRKRERRRDRDRDMDRHSKLFIPAPEDYGSDSDNDMSGMIYGGERPPRAARLPRPQHRQAPPPWQLFDPPLNHIPHGNRFSDTPPPLPSSARFLQPANALGLR